MADNFFRLKNNLNGLEGDGGLEDLEEDEYDALNDETFGSDAVVADDDWENIHRMLAAEEETTRGRDLKDIPLPPLPDPQLAPYALSHLDVERSLHQLLINDEKPIPGKEPAWSLAGVNNMGGERLPPPVTPRTWKPEPMSPKVIPPMTRIPTVEELERKLLSQSKSPAPVQMMQNRGPYPQPAPLSPANHVRHPPGFGPPPGLPPPQQMRPIAPNQFPMPSAFGSPLQKLPPGFPGGSPQRLIGRPLLHHPGKPMFPPGHMPHHIPHELMMRGPMMMGGMPLMGPRLPYPYPHMMGPRIGPRGELLYMHDRPNFHPPPHPILYPHLTQQHHRQHQPQQQQLNWQQKQQYQNQNNQSSGEERDEYARMMTNRQKIWLLNIQMMQLCTDKPFIHDYYYTMWKKKQPVAPIPRRNGFHKDKDSFFANNRPSEHQRERRDSERVYVPLQFENSLGKLQAKSATAPRQVFDLDVVADQGGPQAPGPYKDHRKTKKILLELERLYLLLIRAEEIKAREEKGTPVEEDGEEEEEEEEDVSRAELINRVLTGLLNEERYLSFLCIRKGKMLLIRCLGHITDWESPALTDVWGRMLRSFPSVLRRDKDDALLPKLYPYLKQWSAHASMESIMSVAKSLLGSSRDGRTSAVSMMRASPSPSKPILSYILSNQFGVSAVSRLVVEGETRTSSLGEVASSQWQQFVEELVKAIATLDTLDNAVKPIEPISETVLTSILTRRCPRLAAPLHATAIRVLSS